jgi:hypothetical protein
MDADTAPRKFAATSPGLICPAEIFIITDGRGELWQVDTMSATCQPVTEIAIPLEGTTFERMADEDNLPTGVRITLNVRRENFDSLPDTFRVEAYRAFSGMDPE